MLSEPGSLRVKGTQLSRLKEAAVKGNLVTEARQDLLARDFRSNASGFGETAENKLQDESASIMHSFIRAIVEQDFLETF